MSMNLLPLIQKAILKFSTSEVFLQDAAGNIAALKRMTDHLTVKINPRFRTKGGTCRWKYFPKINAIIQLDIEISGHFIKNLSEDKVFEVLAHELAHAFEFIKRSHSDHGPLWRQYCLAFGGNGDSTHNEEVKHNKVKRIVLEDMRTGKQYKMTQRRAIRLMAWCPHYKKVSEYILDRNLTSH
jgi:predicted SprT family Zn-dependent metalloprotease